MYVFFMYLLNVEPRTFTTFRYFQKETFSGVYNTNLQIIECIVCTVSMCRIIGVVDYNNFKLSSLPSVGLLIVSNF